MACKTERKKGKGRDDCLEAEPGREWFGGSETLWLAGQAVRYLNGSGQDDERNYKQVTSLLSRHEAGTKSLTQLAHDSAEDATLRWNVLHVLGDAGDASAVRFLVEAALERLPERHREGCEGPYDTELLNRTMAVHAIAALSARHPDAVEGLLQVIKAQPDRAVLIEAVKAAADLGHREQVQALLSEQDRWILDLKRVSYREVNAEAERKDGVEVGFVPPRHRSEHTAPHACGCDTKEN